MNQKSMVRIASISLILVALVGMIIVNNACANFFPEQPPSGIQIGNGSVKGTNLIDRISDNTYRLTGNIDQTISIMSDNVVLDGAGYNVQGSGAGTGIFVQERNDVTIKNLKISGFTYGIKLTWQNYGSNAAREGLTISDNTLTGNTYGIYISDFSKENELTGNTLSGNTYGIYLGACSNNYLRYNHMNNNDYNFFVSSGTTTNSANDVDQTNTVNGAPIIYWINKQGQTVPSNAGYVALVNCTKMTIQNLNIKNNGQAILLAGVTDSIVTNNALTQNHNGIWMVESENNRIQQNTFSCNTYHAMYISGSNSNWISLNSFVGNGLKGTAHEQVLGSTGRAALWLITCFNNQIENNQLTGNGEGIDLQASKQNTIKGNILEKTNGSTINLFACLNNTITANTINANNGSGVKLWMTNQTIVNYNNITHNNLGVLLEQASENSILQNNIAKNRGFGIQIKSASMIFASSANVIVGNNFIDNQPDGLDVSIPGVMKALSPEMVPGPANTWSSGTKGNYWSDYRTRYPNATEISQTGIGDTPYFINENNIDHKPLLVPMQISVDSEPPSSSQQPTQTSSEIPIAPLVTAVTIIILITTTMLIYYKQHGTKTQKETL